MSGVQRVAPILPVRDVAAALEFYAGLGFGTRAYHDGTYGFLTWDEVELHVGRSPEETFAPVTVYLFVDDADALATRWQAAGAIIHPPQDTPWGKREAVLVDPDGNAFRFGSPLGST